RCNWNLRRLFTRRVNNVIIKPAATIGTSGATLGHLVHGVRAAMSRTRHYESGDAVGYCNDRDREDEQDSRGSPSHGASPRKGLLERDQRSDERSPRKAHHPEGKERSHQRPTAAQAPCSMPGTHFQCAPCPVTPRAQKEPQGAAALRQADVLQRRELVERGDDQHAPGEPAPACVPTQVGAEQAPPKVKEAVGSHPRHAPNEQITAREQQGTARAASARHLSVDRHPGRDRREHHRCHHHHPHTQEPAESPKIGAGPAIHPCHPLRGRPPGEGRQSEQQSNKSQPRTYGCESVTELAATRTAVECWGLRRCAYAAHENCDVEKAALPSYWMPKASICERVACATASSEPVGWKMPVIFAG